MTSLRGGVEVQAAQVEERVGEADDNLGVSSFAVFAPSLLGSSGRQGAFPKKDLNLGMAFITHIQKVLFVMPNKRRRKILQDILEHVTMLVLSKTVPKCSLWTWRDVAEDGDAIAHQSGRLYFVCLILHHQYRLPV